MLKTTSIFYVDITPLVLVFCYSEIFDEIDQPLSHFEPVIEFDLVNVNDEVTNELGTKPYDHKC